VAVLWLKGAALAIAPPVEAAWLNRELRSNIRATVLSMNAQVNAVGQVVGGPPLGALAGSTTVSTALVVSAGLLSPVVVIFGWLGRRRAPGTESAASDPPAR
jgi:DHA3 family tetracycline resistance protein-like MFS transporter